MDVFGDSGRTYQQQFDPGLIPGHALGSDVGGALANGAAERGYAAFLIDGFEMSLVMRVQVFTQPGEIYFWITGKPQAPRVNPGD